MSKKHVWLSFGILSVISLIVFIGCSHESSNPVTVPENKVANASGAFNGRFVFRKILDPNYDGRAPGESTSTYEVILELVQNGTSISGHVMDNSRGITAYNEDGSNTTTYSYNENGSYPEEPEYEHFNGVLKGRALESGNEAHFEAFFGIRGEYYCFAILPEGDCEGWEAISERVYYNGEDLSKYCWYWAGEDPSFSCIFRADERGNLPPEPALPTPSCSYESEYSQPETTATLSDDGNTLIMRNWDGTGLTFVRQ